MKLVFLGTGPVAKKSLSFLIKEFEVEAVITKQAPKSHRGPAPVADLAKATNLPVMFANSRGELDKLLEDHKFESKLAVLVDYGVIVSAKTINSFEMGIVNSHFSLLPQWRGADPITFSILSGQEISGVSLMLLTEALDEGQLLAQEEVPIGQSMTAPELTEQLIQKSNEMLGKYLPDYASGQLKPYDQPNRPATYSRKLEKADGIIDWAKPAKQIDKEVRAYLEWPKSRAKLSELEVVITKAEPISKSGPKGHLFLIDKQNFGVYCGEGALKILELKPAGKNNMTSEQFLAGYKDKLSFQAAEE